MCTKEEVQKIVTESECRQQDKLEKSHQAIASTISNFGADFKERLDVLDEKLTESVIDRNSIHDTLENAKELSERILEQTTKTNGRVNALETWKAVHIVENANLILAVGEVKGVLRWIGTMVGSAVILAVLNLILK